MTEQATTQPIERTLPFAGWRAMAIVTAVCVLFGGVMWRAHWLQIARADELTARAESQLTGSVEIRARRGAIYDRDGAEMALSVRAESVFVRPRQLADPHEAAVLLAPLLHRSETALFDDLAHETNFRWLARRVSPQAALAIRDLELEGIETVSEWQRYYPMRHRAGHVLGFTGDDGYGLEGIERAYDETLAGASMTVHALRDVHGQAILAGSEPELEQMEGRSIVLTLDAQIQRITERAIQQVVLDHSARTAVAVVMDPHTGDVLAMSNWPHFDPNAFRSSRASDWRNRSLTDAWEPGSTFKVFTYAAALEEGALTPHSPIDCANGRIRIGRHRIRDTHREGIIPAWQVIQVSSNIGAYRMAAAVGEELVHQYYRDFGFGSALGIGLGGETGGILADTPWAEVELANRAFGQGLTATPLQLAAGYSAIANGGELMRPRLVQAIRNKDGEDLERFEPERIRRVVSEQTAASVTRALITVTEGEGTGRRAALPGIAVAGKTGTSQKVDPETRQYGDLWMASFIGFVPADDPLFTIVVMVDEPQDSHYGGEVAAPTFATIAEQALATRGVFVEREPESPELSAEHATEGPVVDLTVRPLNRGLRADAERVLVPDFRGMQLMDALRSGSAAQLEVRAHDWGAVRHQWPAAGASVMPGSQVDIYLQSPYETQLERGLSEL